MGTCIHLYSSLLFLLCFKVDFIIMLTARCSQFYVFLRISMFHSIHRRLSTNFAQTKKSSVGIKWEIIIKSLPATWNANACESDGKRKKEGVSKWVIKSNGSFEIVKIQLHIHLCSEPTICNKLHTNVAQICQFNLNWFVCSTWKVNQSRTSTTMW